ncbi:MAG TPA: 50S ribosomal protein L35 [Steroidobacteraceae bacterium]|jgi:large subunit ribosomal protein L35|nr:50S ribosomal protein L35 [Steroidobacteraceae bacterium]
MPKLKTNRAAAKRFRKTAKGFKRYGANRRHNLGHKDRKVKRHARSGGSSLVDKTDVGRVEKLLPYAR